ncbi:MAG: hypothetical protein EGQ83_04515 [Holdemanella biformis]|nr:hypothetical protein [Holdemanella biformis]
MILGIQTEIFEDVKSRKIFHVKTTNESYLLQEGDDFKVRLLRMNIVDSISIAVLTSLIIQLPIFAYIAIGAFVYLAYLLYFNNKVLPNMQKIKKVERKEQKKAEKKLDKPPFVAFAYLLVGIGLVYCMMTNQVESGTMTYVVIGAMVIAFGLGSFYLYTYYAR